MRWRHDGVTLPEGGREHAMVGRELGRSRRSADDDVAVRVAAAVLVDSRAASKITQGITTAVTGEGQSIAPLGAAMVADQAGARCDTAKGSRTLR